MPWVESVSPSFRARHDSTHAADAEEVLESLELVRERLEDSFARTVVGLTVVLHRSSFSLTLANPLLPLRTLLTAPAARRYVAGWSGAGELHVLAPDVLEQRA